MSKRRIIDWIVISLIPGPVWRTWRRLKHPRQSYYFWKKERAYPIVGERITYHDEPHIVTALDDNGWDVQIDTGEWVSWQHCCGSLR